MTLGATILKYRKQMGITQESLAQQLEVTNQAVSKWESDQCCPDISLLPQLADIFGITIDELFGREAPAKEQPLIQDLPWGDDGNLRGVLYIGRRLVRHERRIGDKIRLFFKERVDQNVYADFCVVCGDVGGSVDAGGSVECKDVAGNVDAGDGINCGNVDGDVDAGKDVNCGNVGGSVAAGSSVNCAAVDGDVDAGSDVNCGNVGGSVDAGGNVTCQNVEGNVDAGGSVTCAAVGGDIDAGGRVTIQH